MIFTCVTNYVRNVNTSLDNKFINKKSIAINKPADTSRLVYTSKLVIETINLTKIFKRFEKEAGFKDSVKENNFADILFS